MSKLIFILSLPRSGSTLLQRLLLGSGHCASLGEPSMLLRFLGDGPASTRRSTYWEFLVDSAQTDMREHWPEFDRVYHEGVRKLMMPIYEGLAGGKEWFIDKTPRYTLIAEEIMQCFPEAKFIVLWRHPLAVAASMTEGRGFWFPEEHAIDLYEGFTRLDAFTQHYKERICEIRYEDLVADPEAELARVGGYLGWDQLERVLSGPLAGTAGGSLGDRTGIKKYNQLSAGSKDSWVAKYNNWYRRRWAHRYCNGSDRAVVMQRHGYELPDALPGPMTGLFSGLTDCVRAANRTARRHRRPVWLKRFIKDYRKRQGYDIAFR